MISPSVTIDLEPGTYDQQVTINPTADPGVTSLGSLTLDGAGAATLQPSSLNPNLSETETGSFFDDDSGHVTAMIGVQDMGSTSVTVRGLTVDGSKIASYPGPAVAIGLINTSGTITANTVENVEHNNAASVHGIEVKADSASATVAVSDNSLHSYPGHVAIALFGQGLTATASDNTIVGDPSRDKTGIWVAQFGIVEGQVASATITGNDIQDMQSPYDVGAIWLDPLATRGTCSVTDNTLTANDDGVDIRGASGCTVSDNTITAGSAGIEVGDASGSPTPSSNNMISDNSISPVQTVATTTEWDLSAAYTDTPIDGILVWDGTGNAIDGNTIAPGFVNDVYIGADPLYLNNTPTWSAPPSSNVSGTRVNGNTLGVFATLPAFVKGVTQYGLANLNNSPAFTLDGTDNYWNSANGPSTPANTFDQASQGLLASTGVTVAPWLQKPGGSPFAPVTDATSGAQFSSIQAAVNAAGAGDTIDVAAGTFGEAVTVGAAVYLDGTQHGVDARTRSGSAESIITGTSGGPDVTVRASGVTLDGFTLDGPSSQGTAAIVMMGPYTGETIENNIINDPGRAVSYNTSDTSFMQNLVRESGTTGDGIQENSGAVSQVTIRDNSFSGGVNNNADITFIGAPASHNKDLTVTGNQSTDPSTFVALFNTDTASITANTVTGATGSAIYIGGGDSGITVQHNLIAASGGPKYAVSVSNAFGDGPNSDVTVTYNALYGLNVGTNGYTGGNVDAEDNWWGVKAGPAGLTNGTVDTTPWLQDLAITPPLVTSDVGAPLQWSASILDSQGTAITDPAFAATFGTSGTATCDNPTSTAPLAFSAASVSFGCTPTSAGDLTITGTVSLDGTPLTLVGTAGVTAVTPPAPSGGTGGGSTPSPTDGNQSGTVTTQNGTTTIDVDAGLLSQNLGSTTDSTVTFTSTTPSADLNLPGDALQSLTQGGNGLSLATPGATYTLPAGSIDMGQLETLLGVTDASDITLSISVTPGTSGDTGDITQGLTDGSIVGDPETFTITATANGQTQTIEVFSGAVPRTFDLGTTPDPSDTTGVVLVNGVPEHAWTVFSGATATIYSHTDSTYAVVTNQVSFTDIAGLPQEAAIQALANKLVISGMTKTTFDPRGGVTRAQFAALVVRALGLWNLGTSLRFSDVPSDSWAAGVVRSAAAESFIQGYPDGTFRPQQQITNAQMAAIVARVMAFLKIGQGSLSVTPTDQASIPAWAAQDVALALSQGIMTTASDGTFQPSATTTRAQAAQIIWNLMQKAGID